MVKINHIQSSPKNINIDSEKFDLFRTSLITFVNEHLKKIEDDKGDHEDVMFSDLATFIESLYPKNEFYNAKGSTDSKLDFVIYDSEKNSSPKAIIVEGKHPGNKNEMITFYPDGTIDKNKFNVKALQELIFYYLNERESQKERIKYLIATDGYVWCVFSENQFDKLIYSNKKYYKEYKDAITPDATGHKCDTKRIYSDIIKRWIDETYDKWDFVTFNLKDYVQYAIDYDKNNPNKKLLELYKFLHPINLLNKTSSITNTNTLDKDFYNELLYILGLKEYTEKNVLKIGRVSKNNREKGSLLENLLSRIQPEKLNNIDSSLYGDNEEEQLFGISLELIVTWLNRIIFMKLLEGQLLKYNSNDVKYAFMTSENIKSYQDLDDLFLNVLGKDDEREYYEQFKYVPYLNSSLFELSDMENKIYEISRLGDLDIPVYSKSVLKEERGKMKKTLKYLLDFLSSYDFSGDNSILTDNSKPKKLINASVLGLIFEKINGYKDGAYFTPSYVTMYICRETIQKAVIQKFKESHIGSHIKIESLLDIENLIGREWSIQEANAIINSLKICDPAVGSGHFLVSALNEIISIKSELKIICDSKGSVIRGLCANIENDELIITDNDGKPFVYDKNKTDSQRIQEAIFNEKRTIIENCLFGVDINQKAAYICRLRLWIELLKNAYYVKETGKLETLPNIDINIKTGNSLISKYSLDTPYSKIQKDSGRDICSYKKAVNNYRSSTSKEDKRMVQKRLKDYEDDWDDVWNQKIKEYEKNLHDKEYDLENVKDEFNQQRTIDGKLTKAHNSESKEKIKKLEEDVAKLKKKLNNARKSAQYKMAFEWRFEFPDVLDNEGKFIGFDCVIGNPPYISLSKFKDKDVGKAYEEAEYASYDKSSDIYCLFYEKGYQILRENGILGYITSSSWTRALYGKKLRGFFAKNTNPIKLIDFYNVKVFEDCVVNSNILIFDKSDNKKETKACVVKKEKWYGDIDNYFSNNSHTLDYSHDDIWIIASPIELQIKDKIESIGTPLKFWDVGINRGIVTGYNEAFIISGEKRDEILNNCKSDDERKRTAELIQPILTGDDIKRYYYNNSNLWVLFIPWHFPLQNDVSITGCSEKAETEFKKQYPSVYNHMLKNKFELSDRNKSETGVVYEWYALQRWGANYWKNFSKQKVMWKIIGNNINFCYDDDGMFCNNAVNIMVGNPKQLLQFVGLMNSKLFDWYLKLTTEANVQGGGVQLYATTINKILLKLDFDDSFNKLIEKRINCEDVSDKEIDDKIFSLYNLDDTEQDFIIKNYRENTS